MAAHPPEWLILEGIAYRRSSEHPPEPPWLHVNRAAGLSVHQQLRGAVDLIEQIATMPADPSLVTSNPEARMRSLAKRWLAGHRGRQSA